MKVLVIDDAEDDRGVLVEILREVGYQVTTAGTARAALAAFRTDPPDLAIVDHQLPDGNGLELIHQLRGVDVRVPLVMLTGHGSIELAVAAVKGGAEQVLVKPVESAVLLMILKRALDNTRNRRAQVAVHARSVRHERDPFLGVSDLIKQVAEVAHRVLDADRPLLIQGETGTGKGVLAGWLHRHGARAQESFVDINCASLSSELLESELFGHERGAFTGAASAKLGLLEVADRGTVFLDEIGEMSVALQPRLLKVLEDRRFRRVGDVRDRTVDVRLITATNQDLGRQSQTGAFRSDLYFRINTLDLRLPALRERPEDIPIIARAIAAEVGGGRVIELTPAAIRVLRAYAWPGNLRELRNIIERSVLLAAGASRLDADDLRFEPVRKADGSVVTTAPEILPDHDLSLEEMERRHVERVVRREGGSVERAAARLGISRSTLYQKLKGYRDRKR